MPTSEAKKTRRPAAVQTYRLVWTMKKTCSKYGGMLSTVSGGIGVVVVWPAGPFEALLRCRKNKSRTLLALDRSKKPSGDFVVLAGGVEFTMDRVVAVVLMMLGFGVVDSGDRVEAFSTGAGPEGGLLVVVVGVGSGDEEALVIEDEETAVVVVGGEVIQVVETSFGSEGMDFGSSVGEEETDNGTDVVEKVSQSVGIPVGKEVCVDDRIVISSEGGVRCGSRGITGEECSDVVVDDGSVLGSKFWTLESVVERKGVDAAVGLTVEVFVLVQIIEDVVKVEVKGNSTVDEGITSDLLSEVLGGEMETGCDGVVVDLVGLSFSDLVVGSGVTDGVELGGVLDGVLVELV